MLENILQLTAVVVVFVLVLAGTYYVTKWIAKSGMIQSQSRNIKVIETFKICLLYTLTLPTICSV